MSFLSDLWGNASDVVENLWGGSGDQNSGIMGLFTGSNGNVNTDLLGALLGAGIGLSGLGKTEQRPVGYRGGIPQYTATRSMLPRDPNARPGAGGQRYISDVQYTPMAEGGLASLPNHMYMGGASDGMSDNVPAMLSDGEFVIPADVVSHLGNGNSNAGAQHLYEMLDRVRSARTGSTKQGAPINPQSFTPR